MNALKNEWSDLVFFGVELKTPEVLLNIFLIAFKV